MRCRRPARTSPEAEVAELSQWLKIMLGEVSRKGEEQSRAVAEARARTAEANAPPATPVAPAPAEVR
jgi:hypothetical protein